MSRPVFGHFFFNPLMGVDSGMAEVAAAIVGCG